MKRMTVAARHVRKRIRPDLVDKAQKILSALEAADSPGFHNGAAHDVNLEDYH